MSFVQTLSGKHFNYLDVQRDAIEIEDAAAVLSHICRFAGHLPEFYSVGQYSVLSSLLVPQEFVLEALLRDAAEAYLRDIPTPLKHLLPGYYAMEVRVGSAICQKFDLPAEQHPTVKYADLVMLASERRDFEIDDGTVWPMLEGIIPTDQFVINPVRPGQVYEMSMNRFHQLMERR